MGEEKALIQIKDNSAIVRVNPSLYPLEVVYSASYVFLDCAYILLDGNPDEEILVTLKPKGEKNPEELANEFFNELINYADYNRRANQTKKLREMILQRALITNDPSVISYDEDSEDILDESEEDEDYLNDPEGIAIPWEEQYGGKNNGNKTE